MRLTLWRRELDDVREVVFVSRIIRDVTRPGFAFAYLTRGGVLIIEWRHVSEVTDDVELD